MNFAKETKAAALRAGNKTFTDNIVRLGEARAKAEGHNDGSMMLTPADINEAMRKANRVFKSRRAGLAGRKARRAQRKG